MRRLDARVEKPPVRGGYRYPSFSSTLLDSIYRSIDDDKPTRGAPDSRWAAPKKPAPAAVTRPRTLFQSTASSSSENSSYGFSSSEPESVPVQPNRLIPVRTEKSRPATLPPPAPEKKKKPSIRNKIREFRKSRSPTSPAARLAGFLNSLFKPKSGADSGEVKKPMTSSAAKCNGSDRSVRFQLPVDGRKTAPPPPPTTTKVMTWRRFDEEDDDVASDSSSDLFELENLMGNGRYRNELPVYETTNIGRLIL